MTDRSRLAFVCALGALIAPLQGAHAQGPGARVVPVLFLPGDASVDARRLELQERALRDVQAWYALRVDGFAFFADPLILQRSRHTFAELAGNDFQNWWPLPEQEFADYGLPWNETSRIKLLLLAQGAGAWAGADSENGGIERGEDPAGVPRGGVGGLAVVGDSSLGGILSGACPREGDASFRRPQGGTAWWCNWNTYRGTIAHELGHTFGLPHPDAFTAGFRCDSTVITNMQCHWAWPADSLLPFESAHLRTLPHFSRGALDEWRPAPSPSPRPAREFDALGGSGEILWLQGRGGGTGYVRGQILEPAAAGASAFVWVPPDWAAAFIADVGRPAAATGEIRYELACGGATVDGTSMPASPPRTLLVPVRDGCTVRLTVSGPGTLFGVGNPRWSRHRD